MKIGNIEIKNKIFLAPMAGYTNLVYREIASKLGAGLVEGEMISAKGLLYDNVKTWDMLKVGCESVVSLQLFGYDIDEMVKAAIILDKQSNCDIIDINMGCPVRKVINNFSGSYLLKEMEHASQMVKAIVKAVSKPVTVKIRAGWDHSSINCVEFARAMEKAGASAIIIHGRTKSDLYAGKCNLDFIKMVKDAVTIPVIGNGDVKSREDAINMLSYTGCDAIMIGRASLGNPWIFSDLNNALEGLNYTYPSQEEKVGVMINHYENLIKLKGEMLATLEMRSLAAWYVKGFKRNKEFKVAIVNAKTKIEFYQIVNQYLR